MTNLESRPEEVECAAGEPAGIEIITSRDVPLGGPRAMTVRRTLPSRERTLIGAWCFCDHYGPDSVGESGGMVVPPHPHTGLQTVSWLFTGEIEHRDSAGNVALVRPGELNLMTGGHGISHSENSTASTTTLHGVQLWTVLPDAARDTGQAFVHYRPEPVAGDGWEGRVFLGSLLGSRSPVTTFSPLLGAELLLEAGARLEVPVEAAYEHGVLVDTGAVRLLREGTSGHADVARHELAYAPPGALTLTLEASASSRLLLLGGPPFGEQIVMWWNFVGRTHEEIVGFREEWQAQITRDGAVVADSQDVRAGRYGVVAGNHQRPIPAPPLPGVRLRTRG
ncbi:MAG: pirin family protein [Nocardioides sp.]|nr:pirin family protein [Nocardioides sp.]